MSDQPIGPILDGLGATLDLDDGDLVESVVVIAKIVGPDGQASLSIADSEGMSWIDRIGMLAAAQQVVQQVPFEYRDED